MSRNMKIFLGILSIASFLVIPFMLMYMFLGFIPEMISLENQGIDPTPQDIFGSLGVFIAAMVFLALTSVGLFIYFVVHLMQDPSATSETRVLWVLLLFFFSNMAYPFYWFFRIWQSNEDQAVPSEVWEPRTN